MAYTVQETAKALGVSADLIYDLIARGELTSVRAGRRRLIMAASLEAWIDRQTEQPKAPE